MSLRDFCELLLISKIYFEVFILTHFVFPIFSLLSSCVWLCVESQTSLVLKYLARFVIHLDSFLIAKASHSLIKNAFTPFIVRRVLVTLHGFIQFLIIVVQLYRIFQDTSSSIQKLGIISLTHIQLRAPRFSVINIFLIMHVRFYKIIRQSLLLDDRFSLLVILSQIFFYSQSLFVLILTLYIKLLF